MKPKCISCGEEKIIISKGLCVKCFGRPIVKPATPAIDEFLKNSNPSELMDALEASLELLANEQGKGTVIVQSPSAAPDSINRVDPAKLEQALGKTPAPTNGIANKPNTNTIQICDVCGNGFKSLQKDPTGKLMVCVSCYTGEQNAAVLIEQTIEYDRSNYKTWPRCNSCHAHVIKEDLESNEGVCTSCAKKKNKVSTLEVKPTDSNLYQEFFNAETTAIVDLIKEHGEEQGILLLRQNIIEGKQLLSKEEAAAFKTKTLLQARQVKYNDMLSKLSLDKQAELRIEDSNYKPKSGEPRKLKSPLSQPDKVKKLKKSLDEQINSMFGGTLSAAEIEEKKKALGL